MEAIDEREKIRKKEIEQKADELLKKHKDCDNGFVDVVKIARNEGFMVAEFVFQDDTDGLIIVNTDVDNIAGLKTNKLIGVSSQRDYDFKRFIIAHELSHYFLDETEDKKKGYILAARDAKHGRSEKENEHDYFAANLLMPKEAFLTQYEALIKHNSEEKTIATLAMLFEVPHESVKRRIAEVKQESNDLV